MQQHKQSALSIARDLGYEQIAAVLERTMTAQAAPMQAGQELHAVSPEVMQEAYMSDDDEDAEGGTSRLSSVATPDTTLRRPARCLLTRLYILYIYIYIYALTHAACTLPHVFEHSLLISYVPTR